MSRVTPQHSTLQNNDTALSTLFHLRCRLVLSQHLHGDWCNKIFGLETIVVVDLHSRYGGYKAVSTAGSQCTCTF